MMDEHELDKQFEATDYDENGNIKQIPPPPIAAKKKRITVAELNKAIDDIRDVKFPETLNWIGEVDNRVDTIERVGIENLPSFISDTTERFQKLEKGIAILQQDNIDIPTRRLDNQDMAIGALADAIRDISEGVATWGVRMEECEDMITKLQRSRTASQETIPKPEIEFAQPPHQTAGGQTRKGNIEAVASVCQTMTDVLLICRLLQAGQDIPDEDRTYLLTIACRAAGVPLSAGLQIRAGATSGGV